MLNDRQSVESLFFTLAFKSALESAGRRDDGYDACIRALDAAAAEVLKPHDMSKRAKLVRRVLRLHDAVFEPTRKGGVRVDKIALEAYYMLQPVLEAGYLELVEGSPLAVAIGAILDAFADAFAEDRLDASARKQAAKAMAKLQADGMFVGVTMERIAA